jgi:hypothetical protein
MNDNKKQLEFYINEDNNIVVERETFEEMIRILNELSEKSGNERLLAKWCCHTHCEDGREKKRTYSSLNRATAATACYNYLVIDCGGPIPPEGSGYNLSKGECD